MQARYWAWFMNGSTFPLLWGRKQETPMPHMLHLQDGHNPFTIPACLGRLCGTCDSNPHASTDTVLPLGMSCRQPLRPSSMLLLSPGFLWDVRHASCMTMRVIITARLFHMIITANVY